MTTTPSILFRCPKCGKEELCITFEPKYCNCTYDFKNFPPKTKGTRMICLTKKR